MTSTRRTVPRPTRRGPRGSSVPASIATADGPLHSSPVVKREPTTERYVPLFTSSKVPGSDPTSSIFAPDSSSHPPTLFSPNSGISPLKKPPSPVVASHSGDEHLHYHTSGNIPASVRIVREAAISRARWLRGLPGPDAFAAVAVSASDQPHLALYAVRATNALGLTAMLRYHVLAPSCLSALETGRDGLLLAGTVDGGVFAIPANTMGETLTTIDPHDLACDDASTPLFTAVAPNVFRGERIAGVATLASTRVAVVGDHGSLAVIDLGGSSGRPMAARSGFGGSRGEIMEADPASTSLVRQRVDECGALALAAVGDADDTVVVGGASGVFVWDARSAQRAVSLRPGQHNGSGVASAVTADESQPAYVQAGLRDGGIAVWDRRAPGQPLGVADAHDGPVWDVRVAACSSRPGRLLSGGEDGSAWVLDYAAAAARDGTSGNSGGGGVDRIGGNGSRNAGDVWRAQVVQAGDAVLINKDNVGVNSIDAHDEAALVVYGTDAGSVVFIPLPVSM